MLCLLMRFLLDKAADCPARDTPAGVAACLPGDDAAARPAAYAEGVSRVWLAVRRFWRSPARDVLTIVVVTAVIVAGSYGEAHPTSPNDKVVNGHPVPYTPNAAYLLVVAAGLVLIWRRRYPLAVLTVSTAAVVAYSLLGYVNGAAMLLPPVAVYAVASWLSLRQATVAALASLAVLMGATAIGNPFGRTGGGFVLFPGLVAAAFLGGIAAANRRAYVDSIRARAETDARQRVDEERLRIARELHDVVAHTMATINVQAGVAAHVMADRPDAAAEALQVIKKSSKEGLRELRAILDVLRQADEAEPTQPTPGLDQVTGLVTGATQAGLATSLSTTGRPRPLPAEVDLAAYRIIQESLTNAVRHAGPATATVSLSYGDTELRIEIADNGLGAPAGASEGSGHGLIGMRERASSVGGTVEAGPRPRGGFLVAARLPIAGQPDDDAEAAPAEQGAQP